jgi:hypothetical protein
MAKGFAPWKPKPETLPFLADVIEVIEAHLDDWPLTQRSWLYRLMAKKGWLKVDEYNRNKAHPKKRHLCTPGKNLNLILDRGRRAGFIPWEAVQSKRGELNTPLNKTCPAELADGPWTPEKRDQFGQTVIDKIERYSPGFKDLIVHMEVRTPHDIESEVGLTEGNIFQGELTIDQLLFNRPFPGYGQYRMPLKNMYMCGSSTHPGGGVSAACGANAAREILRDLRRPNTVPKDDCYDE